MVMQMMMIFLWAMVFIISFIDLMKFGSIYPLIWGNKDGSAIKPMICGGFANIGNINFIYR